MKSASERKHPWFNPELPSDEYDWQVIAYLLGKCLPNDKGCMIFQGFCHKPPRNYGDISYRGEKWRTHRLIYTLAKGPIPDGMVVMHSCDNPPCCNPAHLKIGTHLENMAECRAKDRYYYANLKQCKRGHEFNEENTYYIKTPGPSFGLRACKVCHRARGRMKAGWPEDLAYSLPIQPLGYKPIGIGNPNYRKEKRPRSPHQTTTPHET
ncbi:MAG TPA: HNH endonuclease signature motif containing protein [Nitrospiraceae bacterium]|nr:HNH endonuclease signature motif containing protein [Nitrospiraceae bacterium]